MALASTAAPSPSTSNFGDFEDPEFHGETFGYFHEVSDNGDDYHPTLKDDHPTAGLQSHSPVETSRSPFEQDGFIYFPSDDGISSPGGTAGRSDIKSEEPGEAPDVHGAVSPSPTPSLPLASLTKGEVQARARLAASRAKIEVVIYTDRKSREGMKSKPARSSSIENEANSQASRSPSSSSEASPDNIDWPPQKRGKRRHSTLHRVDALLKAKMRAYHPASEEEDVELARLLAKREKLLCKGEVYLSKAIYQGVKADEVEEEIRARERRRLGRGRGS